MKINLLSLLLSIATTNISAQNFFVFEGKDYVSRLFNGIDSDAIKAARDFAIKRYQNHEATVKEIVFKLLRDSSIYMIQNNFSTTSISFVNQQIEACLVRYNGSSNSDLFHAVIFSYDWISGKIIVHKMNRVSSISLDKIAVAQIWKKEKRNELVKILAPEYFSTDNNEFIADSCETVIMCDKLSENLVVLIASQNHETEKLAYIYFDFYENKILISDVASW